LRQDSWGKNVPVFIIAHSSDLIKMIKDIGANYDFFLKSETPIDTIIMKVKEKLNYGSNT